MGFGHSACHGFIRHFNHRMSGKGFWTSAQLTLAADIVKELEFVTPIDDHLSPSAIKMIRDAIADSNYSLIYQLLDLEFLWSGNLQLRDIIKNAIEFAREGGPPSVGHALNKLFRIDDKE